MRRIFLVPFLLLLAFSAIAAQSYVTVGTGSPEGVYAAPPGSLYRRTDGDASATLYVKTSGTGTTGWTAISAAPTKTDVGLGNVDNTSDATKNSAAASLTNKKLGSLTSNGFVKTSAGDGTLSVDTNTYLTANQSITLSGDISGSGATSITTTIGSGKVTNSMLASQAYMGAAFHSFCTGGSMAASSTVFMPGFGGVATTCTGLGTTRTSGTPVSAGTIKNLRVNLGTGGKSGDAVTVEIAGVASALTCTFGTGTSCSDTTHSAAVTAGQVLTVKVTTGASETAANIVVYFELWP